MIGFLIALAASVDAPMPSEAEIQKRKDWALSRCIGKVAKNDKLKDDSFKSAAAILENIQADSVITDRMNNLADSFIKRKYTGSVKSDYNTLKCIYMYHSKELDHIARS